MEHIQPVERYNPKRKLLIVTLLVCVFCVAVFWIVANLLVDENSVADEIVAHIEKETGLKTRYEDASFSLFPSPKIHINSLSIDNKQSGLSKHIAKVKTVSLGFSIIDIFTGSKQANELVIDSADIMLESTANKVRNWDALGIMLSSNLIVDAPSTVKIVNGNVTYKNAENPHKAAFKEINASVKTNERALSLQGDGTFNGEPVSFDTNFTPESFDTLDKFKLRGSTNLQQGNNFLRYDGVIHRNNDRTEYDGDIAVQVDDMNKWFSVVSSGKRNENSSEPKALKLTAKATTNNNSQVYDNIQFVLADTQGVARLISPHEKGKLNDVQIQVAAGGSGVISGVNSEGVSLWQWALKQIISSEIPVRFDIGAGAMQTQSYGLLKDVVLQATLAGKEIVVNKAQAKMAGDSSFFTVGLLHLNARKKLQYDGNVEISGKRFNDFTASMGIEKERFFIERESDFRARAELFLSEEQLLISGGKFRAGDFLLAGSINKEQENDDGMTITMRAKNFRADAFMDAFFPKVKLDTEKMYDYNSFNRSVGWLSELNERYMVEMVLEDYTLKGKKGKRADIKMNVENGIINAKHVNIELEDVTVRGNLDINQTSGSPTIRGKLSVSHIDLVQLVGERVRTFPVERGNSSNVWSNKNVDFNYFKGYDLDIKLHAKKISHQDFDLTNFYALLKSKEGIWNITQGKGAIWGGTMTTSAKMDLTGVPIFSGQYTFQDIRAEKLLNAFASHKGIFGTMSLSGTFNTNGMNPLAWIQNIKSNISFNSYGVVIRGFDLASVIRAIPSVRNVGDVVNVVRLAVVGRKSSFKEMRGTLNMEDGIMFVPEIRLRSQHTVATMSGQMNIVTWMMNMQSVFALTTLSPDEQPALGITFTDSIDDPKLDIDTREIEKFVAKRKLR